MLGSTCTMNQGMHHAVKFFAIRFRGFQGVRDLRDMRGFHGFHFPRGLVDRIVRDLEQLRDTCNSEISIVPFST